MSFDCTEVSSKTAVSTNHRGSDPAGKCSEWPVSMLGSICHSDRGITYGIVKVGVFVKGGVPVVRGGDIRNGKIVVDRSKCVSLEVSNQFKRTILRGGEIIINLISEPGHSAVVPPELAGYNVSRDVAVIPLLDGIDKRYVDFYLRSHIAIDWLTARLQGSVTQKINLGALRELPVPLPRIGIQRQISTLLGGIDDRIDLLRETNATLEAIAQTLFKSWFVDFDPVHAKIAGRAPEGMDEATAALFSDGFEASELGTVPRGWNIRPLDSIANYLNGLALQKFPPEVDSWLPVIKIAQLRKGDTVGADRCGVGIKSEYIVNDGDVLFSWSGSLEVEVWCGGKGVLNQHLFKVTSVDFPKWFYFHWTRYHLEDFRQTAASKATTMGHIQRGHLSGAKVVVPPQPVISALHATMDSLLARQIENRLQAQTLTTLRDTLLPRLISGQLRLPEAEAQVDEVMA